MEISRDNGGVVDLDYEARAPYAFTGTVRTVVFDLAPRSHEEERRLHGSIAQAGLAHGASG
jgi:arylsulfatase